MEGDGQQPFSFINTISTINDRGMNSNYYIPQTPHLKDVIRSIWQVQGFTSFHKEHIMPKGVIEIIFDFSDSSPIHADLDGKQYNLSNCFINGFNRTPVQLQLPEQQKFFGVQLQPLAIKKIFGIPACEFTNMVVDLKLIETSFHSLWHQMAERNTFEERIAVFSGWIERKLPDWQPQEKMINDFLSGLNRHDLSVKELAHSVCYSPRQLSRKIAEATGMNTEEMLLYKKYLHAVHLIHHTDLSLTKIAYQGSFSDQSHFIKSFRTYTNMTPGEYKANKGYVKGHIYENVR